jgi:hypothetical protein
MEFNNYSKNSFDEWELKLEEKLKEVEACQANNSISSCLNCIKLLECNIRESYVHAVYSSMNKGASGGFEF